MTAHAAHDWRALRLAARHDNRLTMTARVIFEDICDLAAKTGVCGKRPESFATTYESSLTRIKDALKELDDAGFIERRRLPDDRRRKGFAPVWPKSHNPPPREDVAGKPAAISGPDPETEPGIRPQLPPEIRPAPGVYTPPEGGGEARAREAGGDGAADGFDPEAEYLAAFPDFVPAVTQIPVLRSFTDREAFRATLDLWRANGYQPKHLANFRDRYRRIAAGEEGADGRMTAPAYGDAGGGVAAANAFLTGADR